MLEVFDFSDTLIVFIRLLLAVGFGGIIGIERGTKGHHAGMRTYMLVCMGSTLVMCTNLYITDLYNLSDPTRMGAQVISGVSFLGVGTIVVRRDQRVKGLTTAAGLWVSACLGLAIGSGYYSGAIVGIVFIFLIATVMRNIEGKLLTRSRVIDVYLELHEGSSLSEFLNYLKQQDYTVSHMQLIPSKFVGSGGMAAQMTIDLSERRLHPEVMDILQQSGCVQYVEEV